MTWENMVVMPAWSHLYGDDVLAMRYEREKSDLLITLHDIWVLTPSKLKPLNVAHWLPVDCEPLSAMDRLSLTASEATPIAMSKHGLKMLQDCGFDEALYVPHGIDTNIFSPSSDRDALRAANDLEDKFVIGINAANRDPFRKGLVEQFKAFARFYEKHSDARLLFHGLAQEDNGVDLYTVARELGIMSAIRFADTYHYMSGRLTPQHLVNWYSMLDLYSATSFAEGFGLTILEALACGVPVVVTDASAMPEVAGPAGWKIKGEPFYNPKHEADWKKPAIGDIYRVYEEAYQQGKSYQTRKAKARAHALNYSVENVLNNHWVPVLKELETMVTERKQNG